MNLPIHQVNSTLLDAGDMSQASLTSSALLVNEIVNVAVQAVFTGSPVGTLVIEASNDGTTYSPLDSYAVSSAGSKIYNYSNIGYSYIRAGYTKTSGTGSLTIKANGKR